MMYYDAIHVPSVERKPLASEQHVLISEADASYKTACNWRQTSHRLNQLMHASDVIRQSPLSGRIINDIVVLCVQRRRGWLHRVGDVSTSPLLGV